jgi:hypothetical protein
MFEMRQARSPSFSFCSIGFHFFSPNPAAYASSTCDDQPGLSDGASLNPVGQSMTGGEYRDGVISQARFIGRRVSTTREPHVW